MSDFENTIWCPGCGTEIIYRPYIINQREYCCQVCSLGIVCQCGDEMDWEEDYRESASSTESIYPGS